MGVAVALADGGGAALVLAAETATADRLDALRRRGPLDLAITGWRAETLKARAYDGDLARVAVPRDAGIDWVHATADPSRDLALPMKGPYVTRRDGAAGLHRAAIALCKQAHLLPAALVLPLRARGRRRSRRRARLTLRRHRDVPADAAPPRMVEIAAARVPLEVSEAGRVHVFRPRDGGGGALRGRDRRPGPARAGALPAAFRLLHRRPARQPQVRLRPAAPRRARADRRPRGPACCST